jgi:tetracycline resistance efflux pump
VLKVADRVRVSREKIAYLVHSTALSSSLLFPFSSGALFIVSLLRKNEKLTISDPFWLYLRIIPSITFAWVSLILAFLSCFVQPGLGPMKYTSGRSQPIALEELNVFGSFWSFLVPFSMLAVGSIISFPLSGMCMSKPNTLTSVMLQGDVSISLIVGITSGILGSSLWMFKASSYKSSAFLRSAVVESVNGFKTMLPVVGIIVCGWIFSQVTIDVTKTPEYILGLLKEFSDHRLYLLPSLFLTSLIVGFCIGCAWSSLSVIVSIFVPFLVSLKTSDEWLFAGIGALISGAIAGDLISPTSDLTALSSASAQVTIPNHLKSQRVYSGIAILASLGFLIIRSYFLN